MAKTYLSSSLCRNEKLEDSILTCSELASKNVELSAPHPYRTMDDLRDILRKFKDDGINFSLHKGDDSALQRSKPIVPIEISLTIDGTAGIRPGDLFRVDYLPKAYRDFAYFFVSDVGHTMATSGWETTITGLMKVDTAKMIKEGFVLEKPKRKLEFEKYEEYKKELEELTNNINSETIPPPTPTDLSRFSPGLSISTKFAAKAAVWLANFFERRKNTVDKEEQKTDKSPEQKGFTGSFR